MTIELIRKTKLELDNKFRPKTFQEFIGNKEIVEKCQIAIEASKKVDKLFPHMLLSSPNSGGLGKTSLVNIIAEELGKPVVSVTATAIESIGDLVGLVLSLEEGQILFVDEIHALDKKIMETLFPILEDFKINIRRGINKSVIKSVPVKPFTFCGATTNIGKLPEPLIDRFGIVHNLNFYDPDDICKILKLNLPKFANIKITNGDILKHLAVRSRGVPRIALRLIGRASDYAIAKNHGRLDLKVINKAMEIEGVDANGLTDLDRQYLICLRDVFLGGPAGVNAIASSLNQESRTLSDSVEPFLLREGYLVRGTRGRAITQKGENIIK